MVKIVDMELYGVVGDSWFDDFFTADQVAKRLEDAAAKNPDRLNVYINSVGGFADEGVMIHSNLRRFAARQRTQNKDFEIVTITDGAAMSAASVIFMAGDRRLVMPGSRLMIHRAWTRVQGNADDFSHAQASLNQLDLAMARLYASKSEQPVDDMLALMSAETYYDDEQAVSGGMASAIWSEEEEKDTEMAMRHGAKADVSKMPTFAAEGSDKPSWAKWMHQNAAAARAGDPAVALVPLRDGATRDIPTKQPKNKPQPEDNSWEDLQKAMSSLDPGTRV